MGKKEIDRRKNLIATIERTLPKMIEIGEKTKGGRIFIDCDETDNAYHYLMQTAPFRAEEIMNAAKFIQKNLHLLKETSTE